MNVYRTPVAQAHMRSRMESFTPGEHDAAWGDGADDEPEDVYDCLLEAEDALKAARRRPDNREFWIERAERYIARAKGYMEARQ